MARRRRKVNVWKKGGGLSPLPSLLVFVFPGRRLDEGGDLVGGIGGVVEQLQGRGAGTVLTTWVAADWAMFTAVF